MFQSICHVVGARPNFMKAAALIRVLEHYPDFKQILIHTGQHYDRNMSDVFLRQLGLPTAKHNLQVGSGSHAQQTAAIISRLESVLESSKPSLVVVYGDVNSTMAAALVASKLGIPVAHVEAGLRSFDRAMPEEINRVVTDQISDLLFAPSEDAVRNLSREGIADGIYFVGNVMIDTLVRLLPRARVPAETPERYVLVTVHRPSNVDDLAWMLELIELLKELSQRVPVLFPLHPRTARALSDKGHKIAPENLGVKQETSICAGMAAPHDSYRESHHCLRFMEPLPYLEFVALEHDAALVITDSGGIQEETTFLGIPCLTVRENTERPITVECGTNTLVGRDLGRLFTEAVEILNGKRKEGKTPPLWDGHAAERIAVVIDRFVQNCAG